MPNNTTPAMTRNACSTTNKYNERAGLPMKRTPQIMISVLLENLSVIFGRMVTVNYGSSDVQYWSSGDIKVVTY
mgnify:CR=1 FL=1